MMNPGNVRGVKEDSAGMNGLPGNAEPQLGMKEK